MDHIGRMPGETFRMVPDRLWSNQRITPFAIRLWCCLWFLSRDRGETDATDAQIAEELKVHLRTVQRGMANLEDEQFVSRHLEGRTRILRLKPQGDGQPIEQFSLRLVV